MVGRKSRGPGRKSRGREESWSGGRVVVGKSRGSEEESW